MNKRNIDILFVGQDKGRLTYIEDLYNYFANRNLKCEFYVVNPQSRCLTPGIHFSRWISYDSLIKLTEDAKCIVNILQPGAEGVTIRDVEAYNYGCYMITNNPSKEIKDFFNEGQLVDIDNIDERIIDRIKNRTEAFLPKNNTNTLGNFYSWLEKELK